MIRAEDPTFRSHYVIGAGRSEARIAADMLGSMVATVAARCRAEVDVL